ncbi:MAG: AEC family transporter [Oscillospiraceae bacterium]|nr:AEC family transporter [Oscillospiraceae bacterium]
MLSIFLHSMESILTIIIMFMTGWLLTHIGWLNGQTSETFSKLILNVSLPCYMFWNLSAQFDRAKLEELGGGLVVPFLSIGLTYLLGVLVSNLLKVKKGRKGIFRSVFFTSNTIFIGLAVNLALFGEASTPYVLLYYIANTMFFWTVGNYEIRKDGALECGPARFTRRSFTKMLNPALAGFAIAIAFILLGIKLPDFIMESSRYIGEMTTPLAMLFIGIVLHSIRPGDIRLDRDIVVLILARFLICPLTVVLLERFIPLPPLMAKVFVIQSAMPAMTSTGVVAKSYGADYEFGTLVTVLTTLISMISIPVYMVLL